MSAFFVTGAVGAGKTTLLRRILESCASGRKIYGFRTEKVSPAEKTGETGRVFIYPATGLPIRDTAHCVAELLADGSCIPHAEVFEELGVALLSGIPSGAIVLMDELGFLERNSPMFCEKVLEILSRDCFVLGAVKPLAIPFLESVRSHPEVTLFDIAERNRDRVAEEMTRAFSAELAQKSTGFGDI